MEVKMEYLFCQKCKTPLVPIEWIIKQAKKNIYEAMFGVTIHYFTCQNCSQRWAVIVIADTESWGFLQTEAQFGKRLYQRVVMLRKAGISVWQMRYILCPASYIS